MSKTLSLENTTSKLKTQTEMRLDILEERVAELEKAVFKGDAKHFNGSAEADAMRVAPTTSDFADAAKAAKLNKWID